MTETNVDTAEVTEQEVNDIAASENIQEAEGIIEDAAQEQAEEAEHEPTEEELAEQEAARLAAEKAAREAAERAERMEAEREAAIQASAKAVETISKGAGFVTRAGVYYDVDAPQSVEFQYADLLHPQTPQETPQTDAEASEAAETDAVDTTEDTGEQSAEETAQESVETYEDPSYVDPAEFARQVARLTESVTKQSLHREIFYKTLVFCQESHLLREIEDKIATFAEFKHAAASQYHFIKVLEEAGGLERFELDQEGEVITPEQKEGLTEDEIDDLVYDYAFMTTNAGTAVVEQHTPRARIIELLGLVPERKDAYIELMDFVSDEPRTYNEISQLFQGRDVLYRLDADGEPQKMQPSVFVDKLEAAGGIEYRDGWVLTEEGRDFLEELRGSKDA
ncbi:MAG: hypothetical protein IKE43_09325 [Coriobacteriales bacterium]|nr:hypothetical protein [Coriobacteriales bacterium]